MIDKAGEMTGFAVAECERCAGKWLMETDVEQDLLEGNLLELSEQQRHREAPDVQNTEFEKD
jgi:hypothetical protein